ncbi:MAG: LysR family transcriptional regulator [Bdellovibrio sp.]|jgi:DNA-binding transcriptional LysR family regulator
MPDIPIQLLQAFYIFGQSASMVEAAKTLGITQPALSKQLQALEHHLPTAVFTQVGKRKVMTSFGENLHRQLHLRLADLNQVVTQVSNLSVEAEGARVRLSARREVLDRIAAQVRFTGALIFLESSHDETLKALQERRTDLGLTHKAPESFELIAKPLFRETFQLVIPKKLKSPIRSDKDLFEHLPGLPCLAYKEQDEVLESLFKSQGLSLRNLKIARVTSNYQSLAKMLEAGLGWAVLPTYYPMSPQHNWILKIPARLHDPRDFQVLYRRELSQAAWLKSLILEIQRVFKQEELRRGSH